MTTMTEAAETLVAIYARYSTDRQDARSIDDQIRRCRAYATAHGQKVVAEYKDAAVSGAHVVREDMQRLLKAAQVRPKAPFQAVLVDDLSRLSRDLGNTWNIVFGNLASASVNVVDVTTGLSSGGAGARLTFGAMALVNDTFLQLVRTETHRGLEGRALGGFWTGGRCYGYVTVQEENPPDPEHPRKRAVIDPVQAAVVVRVFRLFAEGTSLKKIAATLNEEGLEAPNDGGRGNKNGHGWGHTTIRAMLCNERYLGRFVWNQSKWVRVPGRKTRRRVVRPSSEWVVQEHPELAIVPRDLWDNAQARFRLVCMRQGGRPAGSGKHPSLISGLLRCGVCGGSMTVVGRRRKAGVVYTRFGCTAHYSRGAAICPNGLSVSERRTVRVLLDSLKETLESPEVQARFEASFRRRSAELGKVAGRVGNDGQRAIQEAQKRVANLTESLARLGWSEAVATKLAAEEAKLEELRSKLPADATPAAQQPVPDSATIRRYLSNLFGVLEADPARGRELLAKHVRPVLMTPQADGAARSYRATGAFNLAAVVPAVQRPAGKSGCAGRI